MNTQELDEKLGELEKQRTELTEKIAELRKCRPAEAVEDYTLHDSLGAEVKLSQLFGDKSDLLVIHNMGAGCVYCTLWADGFNSVTPHLEDRTAFVVISPDTPENQRKFAEGRGWTFKMASAAGTAFTSDMGYEPNAGEYWPGASAFHKNEDGSIVRVNRDFFGPGDSYCAVWHLLDLLADGANEWQPKYRY